MKETAIIEGKKTRSSFPAAAPLNFDKIQSRDGETTSNSNNKKTRSETKKTTQSKKQSTNKKRNARDESSLKALTKRFVTLIGDANNGVLDLNEAAKLLSVQKRRIYDITNVLEGIELIEKKGKNNIKWRGSGIAVTSSKSEESQEISQIKKELQEIQSANEALDAQIERAQQNALLPEDKALAYVRHDDITNIPTLQDRTIIAVRAPPGTTLTVPDPDDGMQYTDRRYQIFLKSKEKPIRVYLLNEDVPQQQNEETSIAASTGTSVTSPQPNTTTHHLTTSPALGLPPPNMLHTGPPTSPSYPTTPPPHHRILESTPGRNLLSPTNDFSSIRQLSPPREEPAFSYSSGAYGISDLFM